MTSARILALLGIGLALVAVLGLVLDAMSRDAARPLCAVETDRVAALEAENARLKQALARLRADRPLEALPAERDGQRPGPQLHGAPRPPPPDTERPRAAPPSPEVFLDALRRALKAGQPELAGTYRTALLALGRVSVPPLLRVLRDEREDDILRVEILKLLLVLQGAGVRAVALEVLDGARTSPVLRDAAMAHLPVEEGMPIPAAVRAVAQDPDASWPYRQRALRILMGAAPEEGADAVRRMLDSGQDGERERGIELLAGARHPAFAPLIREVVGEESPPPTVRSLLNALAAMKGPNWGTVQATGPPDTPIAGDLPTAWASRTGDMGDVWVEFDFARSVVPEDLRVHETYNPGAIKRVEAKQPGGRWFLLWEGIARGSTDPRWFEPPLARAPARTRTIRVVLDTDAVPGWNEIDAVELIGDGHRQWAEAVRASSTYGM